MSSVSGKVSWFEITTSNMSTAASFYRDLFGWELDGHPSVYLTVAPTDGGIAGGLMPVPSGVAAYATFGVEVDDVDEAHRRAVDLGATTVIEPTDNPGGVRSAYLRDLDGSLFSVYRFGPPTTA